MNTLTTKNKTFVLSTLCASVPLWFASAQVPPTNSIVPATRAVMTDSNSVLKQPTNFFAANSNLIAAVVPGGTDANALHRTNIPPAYIFIGNAASNAFATNMTGDVTLNTNGAATLAASGVAAGTATKVTVDAKGRVTGTNALVAADIPSSLPFANGGSAAATQAGFISAAFGMTNFTEVGNPPTQPTNNPIASFTPQLSLTTGANGRWMRFWDGSNWKSLFIFGTNAVEFFTGDNNVYFWATNGVDNCIELRNFDPAHYSAARFMDLSGNEVGAVGYGNTNSGYPDMDYLESLGLLKPFYYVAGGHVIGGLTKTTGDFIWEDSTYTNTMFWIRRSDNTVNITNELNVSGIIRVGTGAAGGGSSGGKQATTSLGFLNIGDFDNSQTGTVAHDSANVHGTNFTANMRSTYAVGPISFDAGGNGSGLNYQTTGGAVGIYFGLAGALNGMWTGANQLWDSTYGSMDIGSDVQTAANDGAALLKVHGSFGTAVASKSANYTLTMGDSMILVTATGKVITLPDATAHTTGRIYTIKLAASGSCTLTNGTGSQNIDGALSYSLSAQYKYVTVQSDGTQWWIIANN